MSILIHEDTTFIVQGITGREAVNLTRECLDYGKVAKVVGGVTPGRKGRDVHGVPVFDTVEQAVEHHGSSIKGSVVTVPPACTKDAACEAGGNASVSSAWASAEASTNRAVLGTETSDSAGRRSTAIGSHS